MTLLQHHVLACLSTALAVFALGLLVFLAGPRNRLNQVFGLYSLAISWWAFFEIFMVTAPSPEIAYLFSRVEWSGIPFIRI